MIDKIWNKDLAGHPLNWVILVIMVILFCYVINGMLDFFGLDKPVTNAKQAKRMKDGRSATLAQATTVNEAAGAPDYASAYETL